MAKFRNYPLLAAAFLFLMILHVPTVAWADAPVDNCANGAMDKAMKQAFGQTGTQVVQAQNAAIAMFGVIDVKAQSCWQNIETLFSTLGGLSDPLGLVWGLIAGQIIAAVDQLCSSVLSSLDQLKNSALSQFNRLCLPIPDFGLNLNFNLNLGTVTCNGVSPITGGGSIAGPTPLLLDFRDIFNKQ